ncbi:hypothetical protein B0J11DRAFT_119270 [Dendryphion nanum]|uniref:Uncharacterized protein n=1 Tax=Dendryphion nanum TaxID=256645 RepID=A0A9P9DBN8_9PLEO|nr:hypothetical protein B0J11DRAFT_119270 [Dendryphion nanum]
MATTVNSTADPVMEATLFKDNRTDEQRRPPSPHHGTLEPVPQFKPEGSSYIFSMPDQTPPYAHEQYPEVHDQEKGKRNWKAWPFLILYGLLLALLGGIIGGFVGKAIESKNHNNASSSSVSGNGANTEELRGACSSAIAIPTSSVIPTSIAPSATPSASEAPTVTQAITIPTTGCNPKSPDDFGSFFNSKSTNLGITFTTFCSRGWVGEDVFAMSAMTPSDCIEACAAYNRNKATNNATCVGGGFIPSMVNTTDSMRVLADPFNCYLKKGTKSTGKNNRSFEVVTLCLEGQCTF